MTPAVFLDRDGTLIEEVGYLDRLERMTLFPWSADAVRLLNRAGYTVVMVTNQAGVARGMCDERFVQQANELLVQTLAASGAVIARCYYCPHHPDAPIEAYRRQCECRKPRPGMLQAAARELALDLPRSFVVGDRLLDVRLAHAVGARGILVRTGYGAAEEARRRGRPASAGPSRDQRVEPDAIADNLMQAAVWILEQLPPEARLPVAGGAS